MPVYNCSKYIYDSTISILNQTFSDFELIIIDDCSTDNTVDILKKFNDERIVLIVKQKNTGITNSLNYALDIAKGKYRLPDTLTELKRAIKWQLKKQ